VQRTTGTDDNFAAIGAVEFNAGARGAGSGRGLERADDLVMPELRGLVGHNDLADCIAATIPVLCNSCKRN
jgi:hypothetical protein